VPVTVSIACFKPLVLWIAYNNVVIFVTLLIVFVVIVEIYACALFIFISVACQAQRTILVLVLVLVLVLICCRPARRGCGRRVVILINLRHRVEHLRLSRALAVGVGHCRGTVKLRDVFGGWSFRAAVVVAAGAQK
jgi:hypothetical protein